MKRKDAKLEMRVRSAGNNANPNAKIYRIVKIGVSGCDLEVRHKDNPLLSIQECVNYTCISYPLLEIDKYQDFNIIF